MIPVAYASYSNAGSSSSEDKDQSLRTHSMATILFSSGLSYTLASFGWYHHFSDFGCKFFLYVRGVGRGVSIGTTCLLSIIQAITISPMNSSGSMVFILYRHKQRVQHIHRTHLFSPSAPEARATKTILLLIVSHHLRLQ
ncbi:vomeronasal 1 receptor 1 [Phyllostomus discolor]|uniref:Vomeronasal type-1 receptor n=1 Tax=Phyllostomus discolor TaxID=89673 RepID=A0A834DHD0_9CHIR|nr:vomeronasal 1 receptor 1 [Phyllostomus discolor]